MEKGETICYKTGTEKHYRCLCKFEERCKTDEVIITTPILAAAYSPRLWIPEEKGRLTGQARRNYEKWPEWLSKNFRIILWQTTNYINMVQKELEECWIKSKHDRNKVLHIFENRIKSLAYLIESIREEKSKAIILPSIINFEFLKGSCSTKTQSAHIFYKTYIEGKNYEGLYSYHPEGIKGLDLITAEYTFMFLKNKYDILKKSKKSVDFQNASPSNFDLVKAYDYSYRTFKNIYLDITDTYKGLEFFEKYEFHDVDWWFENILREKMGLFMDKTPKSKDISLPVEREEITVCGEETKTQRYRIYSHGNKRKFRKATREEVEDLLDLSSEEKEGRYDIFLDAETSRLWVKGKYKEIAGQIKSKTLLVLFLKNVGSLCKFADIGEIIWRDPFVPSNSIHQQKDIVCSLTDEIITPFIVKERSVDWKSDVYYIRKESQDRQKLKYCLIIPENL